MSEQLQNTSNKAMQPSSNETAETTAEQTSAETLNSQDTDIQENKLWAFLSYLWILSVIILLVKKDSPYAHYHAKQGSALFIISIITTFIDAFMPYAVIGFVLWIVQMGVWVLVIVGIINVLNGRKKPLPIIGAMVEDLKL